MLIMIVMHILYSYGLCRGPDVWSLDLAPDYQDELPFAVKAMPRELLRLTAKQVAEAPQEGEAYVVQGKCRLCRREVEPGSWGNLRRVGRCLGKAWKTGIEGHVICKV